MTLLGEQGWSGSGGLPAPVVQLKQSADALRRRRRIRLLGSRSRGRGDPDASRFPSPADTAAPSDHSRSLDDPAPNWLNQ